MDTHIRVPVETLQQAAAILLRHLETMQGPVVVLDADFYWAISPEQRVDVYSEPSEFTIGQLTDCLENVSGIVEDPSRSTSYALVWLADLLRAVGEATVR